MRFSDWASLRYHLLWAYEGRVLPSATTGSYTNWTTSCWLVRKGQVELKTPGHRATAKAGQWAFVASPTRHQNFSKDAEILSLHFHLTWPDGEQVIDRRQTLILNARDHSELEKSARPVIRHVKKAFPSVDAFLPAQPCNLEAFLKVQSLLPMWIMAYLQVLARLGQRPRRLEITDDRLLMGASILNNHRLSEPFRESTLVKQVGLNRSRFDALFIAAYGITPRRYLERRRLEAAKELLQHTSSSVKEIALGLGFRHASHFSLWFRRLVGMSASDFRATGS